MKMGWGKVSEILGLGTESPLDLEGLPSRLELRPIPLPGEFDSGYALDEYRNSLERKGKRTAVGELVYRFKYKCDRDCGSMLAEIAERFVRENAELRTADLMITVPPSFTSRPFDPISLLAEEVSRKTNIPYQKGLITRVRLTGLQKKMPDKKAKIQNVSGAFELTDTDKIKDKRVLLVDDLYASGATINEVARILKARGAKNVLALILIKTSWIRYS